MLTTREMTDALTAPSTPTHRGRLAYLAHREAGKPITQTSQRQLAFLDDMLATPTVNVEKYVHPADQPPRRKEGPLTPAEIAWLQRIPADPAQVPHEDARTLAAMDASISLMEHPADSKLVRAVWAPVVSFHDRNAAQVALRNAQQPLPAIPSSALGAAADAHKAETPALTPSEAMARASQLVSDAAARRTGQREQDIARARAVIDEIDAADRQRTAVTR